MIMDGKDQLYFPAKFAENRNTITITNILLYLIPKKVLGNILKFLEM